MRTPFYMHKWTLYSKTILFTKLPIPSTSTSTTSPLFKNPLPIGFMNSPTPLGVPVMITVPALNVIPLLKCSIICATLQIISSVPVSCLTSPFTLVLYLSFCGSPITAGETIQGPIGAKPSKDLAYPNCPPETDAGIWKFRAETSLPQV